MASDRFLELFCVREFSDLLKFIDANDHFLFPTQGNLLRQVQYVFINGVCFEVDTERQRILVGRVGDADLGQQT